MVGEEPLQSLLDTSAEAGQPFNTLLEHQGSASWLFAFSGARPVRNRYLRELQPLGPFEPFHGSMQSPFEDLLAQSVKAHRPVITVADSGQQGTLVVGFSGDAQRAKRYAVEADAATHGEAQQVHAQAVNVKTDIEPGP